MNSRKVIVIKGPTASGKTSLSLEVANKYESEIVNFDSLLFYKELNIGVAKPTQDELESCIHHFVSTDSIKTPVNAFSFSQKAVQVINNILDQHKTPILVGGSGFYLQAIIQGMYESASTSKETKIRSDSLYRDSGITPFLKILEEKDLDSFKKYHAHDHYRIRRAVEYYWDNNGPISMARDQKETDNQDKSNWPSIIHSWDILDIYLDIPKEDHLKIIDSRTQSMMQNGLIKEVEELLTNYCPELKPLKSIGYKETINFLQGDNTNKDSLIERINISTRQLAKAQRTWFKKRSSTAYHPLKDRSQILQKIESFLNKQDINYVKK